EQGSGFKPAQPAYPVIDPGLHTQYRILLQFFMIQLSGCAKKGEACLFPLRSCLLPVRYGALRKTWRLSEKIESERNCRPVDALVGLAQSTVGNMIVQDPEVQQCSL